MMSLYQTVMAGGNVKSFLLDLHKRNTGEIRMSDIADLPTMMISTVSPNTTEKLPACLPVDKQGRCYVKIINLEALTIDLADLAVNCFLDATGVYPDELVACPSRNARLNTYYFFPLGHLPIPFVRDFMYPIDYDLLARGYV